MKIGLVGSTYWLNESLKRITADFPDITFIPFPYTKLIELPSLIEGEQAQCDYFLFLGETARRWTAKHLHPIVPWYGIPRSSSAFLRILAKASYAGYPPRFITDFQNPDFFRHALDEAGISPTESYIRYISYGSFTAEGYMEKNAELMKKEYQKGKAAFCTTIFITTYEILKKEHVPVYYMLPSFEDIRHTVQELITSIKVQNKMHPALAAIFITIDAPSPNLLFSISPQELLFKKLSVAHYIYDFSFHLQGSCKPLGTDSFSIFTTYQPLEMATHVLTRLDLLRIIEENTGLTVSIGLGYGLTAWQAELRAKKAWQCAIEHKGNCAFFVGEKESIIGPIMQESAVPLKESQEYLTLLAKRAGINFQYLQIMSNLCKKEHRNTFTPAELADASGIRKRTMNRILLKLIDLGCCIEKGKNYPKQRGRPSRIIELHLESPPTIK